MWQGLGFLQGSGPRKRCAIGQGLRQAHRRFWGEAGASRTWVSNLTRRIKEVQRRRRHREARPRRLSGHHHTQPPPRAISVLCSTVGFGGLWALRKLGHLEGNRGCLLRRTALARAVTNGRLLLPKHRGPLCSSFPVELFNRTLVRVYPVLLLFSTISARTSHHHNTPTQTPAARHHIRHTPDISADGP